VHYHFAIPFLEAGFEPAYGVVDLPLIYPVSPGAGFEPATHNEDDLHYKTSEYCCWTAQYYGAIQKPSTVDVHPF